jgi:hypothetical protein
MTKLNHNLFTIGILTSLIGWTSAQCAESEPAVLETPTEQNAPLPVPYNVFTVDGRPLPVTQRPMAGEMPTSVIYTSTHVLFRCLPIRHHGHP